MLYRSFHNLLFPANLKREGEVIPMNHVENKKKLNNKGFSLVELIIVIAIMAVLIGVLAPQYLRYVEKSRRSADATMADEFIQALQIAASDPAVSLDSTKSYTITSDATGAITFSSDLASVIGASGTGAYDTSITTLKFQSTLYKGVSIKIELKKDGNSWKVDENLPDINS